MKFNGATWAERSSLLRSNDANIPRLLVEHDHKALVVLIEKIIRDKDTLTGSHTG